MQSPKDSAIPNAPDKACVGFVILFVEDLVTLSLDDVLARAINAGLNHAGLSETAVTLFKETFCAGIIQAYHDKEARTVEALKTTLSQLGLEFQSLIAICDPETPWRAVHGTIPPGLDFGNTFFHSDYWKEATAKRVERTKLSKFLSASPDFAEIVTALKGHKPSAQ